MKTARFTCHYGEFEVDYDGPHPPCTVIAKGKHGHVLLFVVSWAVIGSEVTATRVEVAELPKESEPRVGATPHEPEKARPKDRLDQTEHADLAKATEEISRLQREMRRVNERHDEDEYEIRSLKKALAEVRAERDGIRTDLQAANSVISQMSERHGEDQAALRLASKALEEHRDVRDERDALREHLKTHQDSLVEVDRQRERVAAKEHELQWLRERIQRALSLSKSPSMLGYVREMKERFDLEPDLHEQVMRVVFDCNNALDKTLTWGEVIELQTRKEKMVEEFAGDRKRIDDLQRELAAEREQVGLLKHALEEAQKELQTLKSVPRTVSGPSRTTEPGGLTALLVRTEKERDQAQSEMEGMRVLLKAQDAEIRQYQRARGYLPDEVTPEILRATFDRMARESDERHEKIRKLGGQIGILVEEKSRYHRALVDITNLAPGESPVFDIAMRAIGPQSGPIKKEAAQSGS